MLVNSPKPELTILEDQENKRIFAFKMQVAVISCDFLLKMRLRRIIANYYEKPDYSEEILKTRSDPEQCINVYCCHSLSTSSFAFSITGDILSELANISYLACKKSERKAVKLASQ